MKIADLLALGSKLTEELVADKLISFALGALGPLSGPLGWLVSFIVKTTVKYLVWPGVKDIIGEGKVIINCSEIDNSVELFKEASSAEDKHDAFSNLG